MSFFEEFKRIAIGRSIPSLSEAKVKMNKGGTLTKRPMGPNAKKAAAKKVAAKAGFKSPEDMRKAAYKAAKTAAVKRGTTRSLKPFGEGSLGNDKTIAANIIQQMGGKLRSMLGASLMAVENGLQIKWPNKKRSLGNVCVVTLTPSDTYDMEFFNGAKSVKKFTDLHAEDLIPTFEGHTGWYLHL